MLRKANVGLDEHGREMVKAGPGSKKLKQKLASASYEYVINALFYSYLLYDVFRIAKYVKELISLLE